MQLTEFRKKVKELTDKASILDKASTNKKECIAVYTQLVEFIINFVKSKDCPANLRKDFHLQAMKIINYTKHLQEIDGGVKKAASPPGSSKTPLKEVTESDFVSLPEVPTDNPVDESPSTPSSSGFPSST